MQGGLQLGQITCNLYDKQQDSRTLESNCKIKQQTNTLATVLGGQVLLPIKSSP